MALEAGAVLGRFAALMGDEAAAEHREDTFPGGFRRVVQHQRDGNVFHIIRTDLEKDQLLCRAELHGAVMPGLGVVTFTVDASGWIRSYDVTYRCGPRRILCEWADDGTAAYTADGPGPERLRWTTQDGEHRRPAWFDPADCPPLFRFQGIEGDP